MSPGPRGTLLCLVTDGGSRKAGGGDRLLGLCRAAARAGVDLIQVREPQLDPRSLLELTRAICGVAQATPCRVVVNDRLDVALAAKAHGVHLRADSPSSGEVRAVVPPGFLIGRSVHSPAEAAASEAADYLIVGTVYPTPAKPESTSWLGTAGLGAVVQAASAPVLAIGGVSADKVEDVAAAGASGIAAIRLFSHVYSDGPPNGGEARLLELVTSLRAAFGGAG